jgi:hypothetical protein
MRNFLPIGYAGDHLTKWWNFAVPSQTRIAKGMDADLVVLSADPAQDVTAFSRVRYTIRDGTIIYSSPQVASGAFKHDSK